MPAVTITKLNNADLDCDHIADVATSLEDTATDRLGNTKLTVAGAVSAMGKEDPVAYTSGLSMSRPTQTIERSGIVYAPLPSALPFTTSGTWTGSDDAKFRVTQGVTSDQLALPGAAEGIGWIQAGTGSVARDLQDKTRELLSVKDSGAVGDWDPGAPTGGTDNATPIQSRINQMAVVGGLDIAPSNLTFPKGYYKTTEQVDFPFGFIGNHIDGQGSSIVYRGTAAPAGAILAVPKNQFVNVHIKNLMLRGEDLVGYGLKVVGDGAFQHAATQVVVDGVEIRQVTERAVQIGAQETTGQDTDAANWSYYDTRYRLPEGVEGVEIDADNSFNQTFFNTFMGSWGEANPGTYLRQRRGAGLYSYSLFTGNNQTGVPAVEILNGNAGFWGWNTEGGFLLKLSGFAGNISRDVIAQCLLINDAEVSATPTIAIDVDDGALILDSATLGRTTHQKIIDCEDTIYTRRVALGTSADGLKWGRYELTHPGRCNIEGRWLTDPCHLNPNARFNLWWGSGADHMPVGYFKSALGTATVTRSTSNLLDSRFTARVQIAAGAAASGGYIDGLINRTIIAVSNHPSMSNYTCVVRGKVAALTGTTTIQVRITYINAFASASGSSFENVTPDGSGNFTVVLSRAPDLTDPPTEVLVMVGTGVAGATADIYVQTVHLLQMAPYLENAQYEYKVRADIWTRYPAQENIVEEYAKAGVTARWNTAVSAFVREYLGPAMSGTAVRGDRIINLAVSPGGSPGEVCTTAGTVGSTAVFKAEAAVAA